MFILGILMLGCGILLLMVATAILGEMVSENKRRQNERWELPKIKPFTKNLPGEKKKGIDQN